VLYSTPLIGGRLIKRYKRFMADVLLEDGTQVTAHCANSGSMLSVNTPDAPVWISKSDNPNRKLAYTWEIIQIGEAMVGVNTGTPNVVVAEALSAGRVPELAGYSSVRREVKYGKNSRIDVLLEDPEGGKPPCYVEVKNVTMKRDPAWSAPVEFPDGVTSRGAKHLVELADMVAEGHRAVMVYLVQRTDGGSVTMARDIDPTYAEGLTEALAKGVEVVCLGCEVDPAKGVWVNRTLPLAP
jgi:sugar fermentation stimulation protein A